MRTILYVCLIVLSCSASDFLFGVGGFDVCKSNKGASYYKECSYDKREKIFNILKEELPIANAISIWITRSWKGNWFPIKEVNQLLKNGYTPIFIFYWFGDDISPSFVSKHKNNYFKALKRFVKYLKKIDGRKIVILNPEFNQNGIAQNKAFDLLQVKSILLIKKECKNVLVGICPGDFGNYSNIWDEENWNLYKPSMEYSAKVADFIAFQEMRAFTKNSKKEILDAPLRALAFSTYLHKTYNKPTFLAYLAISSYGKDGENIQKKVFEEFIKLLPLFKHSANLIGLNIFHYIDVPGHQGYFKEAESFFGIKRANGTPKPSFYILNKQKK